MTDYTIAVLEDAIAVLDALSAAADGLTLTEIARETGLVKNKTFRILATLEKHRLVQRDEEGAYRLGLRFFSFSERLHGQTDLTRAAQPVMDRLAQETGESIFLGIIDGREALCVDARESRRTVRLYARVGRRAPLYAGGIPKLLLAFLPENQRQALLDEITLEPFTEQTVVDRAALEALLARVREQGYIVAADDLDQGAHSIGAPIRDFSGRVVAAISIAGPSVRFTDDAISRYVELVCKAADDISVALGYAERQRLAGNGDGRWEAARAL